MTACTPAAGAAVTEAGAAGPQRCPGAPRALGPLRTLGATRHGLRVPEGCSAPCGCQVRWGTVHTGVPTLPGVLHAPGASTCLGDPSGTIPMAGAPRGADLACGHGHVSLAAPRCCVAEQRRVPRGLPKAQLSMVPLRDRLTASPTAQCHSKPGQAGGRGTHLTIMCLWLAVDARSCSATKEPFRAP